MKGKKIKENQLIQFWNLFQKRKEKRKEKKRKRKEKKKKQKRI